VSRFPYLFVIELQGNSIHDLSPLQSIKYLVRLDLSDNQLKDFYLSSIPFNLQEVNLSRNQIKSIHEISNHKFLSRLALDDNLLCDISSLNGLQNLKVLTLSGNELTSIEALRHLPIKTLDIVVCFNDRAGTTLLSWIR
jgi:Leucine-rich repeat (LRR) protein